LATQCPRCHSENSDTAKFCAECGTQITPIEDAQRSFTKTLETPVEELTTGITFADRYQIIEQLGKGGMGSVYKALDKKINEKVALKLIKPEIAADKKIIERFTNELRTARKIGHRNVGRMFDINEEKGAHYITMEYVSGQDLKGLIRQSKRLAVPTAVAIAREICEGLAEAHRLGIVHRDLKPSNIMIDREGTVRIMDFGIARSLKAKGITGAGVMIGTPEYMSPEQAEAKEIDQRTDIYSLGVILYEMVTGQLPFEGDTPLAVAMKHKGETPKDPRDLNPQIPEDLNRVILGCLEKDKDSRYQSADEARSELTNIEKGIPSTAKEVPVKKPLTSKEITVLFSVKKIFIPAFIFAAVVIIGVIIWQVLPKKAAAPIPSDKPSLAVMYFQNNTGDENLDIWRDGLSRMLIADLSQSKYIRVVPDDQLYGILNQLNLLEAKNYSTEDLKEVASRSRSTHILKGILTKSGESFRINTTLQVVGSMEIIDSETVDGKGEGSLHTMVDDLTRRIKESVKLSEQEIAGDNDRDIGKITTSSPEAYKFYIAGRQQYNNGNSLKSVESLEKAVSIDSEFAMAYVFLGITYHWNLSNYTEADKCFRKAFELTDRLSERELLKVQGQFYMRDEKTYDKAIEAFDALSELYPDDEFANRAQGWLYFTLEEWDKAINYLKLHIQNKLIATPPYINLALAYVSKGLYEQAKEVLEYYLSNISESDVIHGGLAHIYHSQGKHDLALAEVNKAISLNPESDFNLWIRGNIYLYRGDLNHADIEYQKLLGMNDRGGLACLYLLQGRYQKSIDQAKQHIEFLKKHSQKGKESNWHQFLALIHLNLENFEEALKEGEKALEIAVEVDNLTLQRAALYGKGLTRLKMQAFNLAQKEAEELKVIIEQGMNRKHMRYYFHLMGMIEINGERFPEAIDYFSKAVSLLPNEYNGEAWSWQALFKDSLASAYYKSGNFEKALEEYNKITDLTIGRLYNGDIYAKSFYMLGKIYEQQGNTAKAIEHYEKFLDLWKDADPGRPEVANARERVAAFDRNLH
jgi:serine/threonine protein kinase/Flp pilus assembly protein TadD